MINLNLLINQKYLEFSHWRHNSKTPYYLKQLRESQWWPKEEIEKLQLKKLKRLIHHAYKSVPHYKKIMKENNLHPSNINNFEEFRQIPILMKSEIQENLNDFVSGNVKKENLKRDATGGSTGKPLTLYKDKNYSEHGVADRYRSYELMGYIPGYKLARLWGAGRDMPPATLRTKIGQIINRSIFLNTFNITEKIMQNFTEKLNKFKPDFIIGYASSLYLFARYLQKNNVGTINPKAIQSSAEQLFSFQRELIEKVFNSQVYNHYGCRELGGIACECNYHNGLHIFSENQYVEILDSENKKVSKGEVGKVIVTNLNNYSFPFIRYEIGDMARESEIEKCDCGRGLPLICDVVGRVTDNFILPNGKIIHGEYFTHLFYGVNGVNEFQVIQEKRDIIVIKIVKNRDWQTQSEKNIISWIKEDLDEDIEIKFKYVKEIEKTETGKYRFTISKISNTYQ